ASAATSTTATPPLPLPIPPIPITNNNSDNLSQNTSGSVTGQQPIRVDILKIKGQLSDALGDSATTYWSLIKNYMAGRSSRQALEDSLRPILFSQQTLKLHNEFLFGLTYNAYNADGPPAVEVDESETRRKKHGRDEENSQGGDDEGPQRKRKKIKDLVMSLGRDERKRIKEISKNPSRDIKNSMSMFPISLDIMQAPLPSSSLMPINHPPLSLPELQQRPQDHSYPLSCVETLSLPTRENLRARLQQATLRNNQNPEIPEDCVELLNYGLETHIKTIIAEVLKKTRTGGTLGLQTSHTRNSTSTSRVRTITPKDLAFTFNMSPDLLVQESQAREKLTAVVLREGHYDEDNDDEFEEEEI
ncbi:8031_t:CDS:2, partial [Ambispora leptoticha]